ncbi:MAG: energy-coupling factor transport system ATP-binding protein, partial [Chloroflexota bacterium]|nr:energy-coupling factor transport system ATP-binding protein [Chloroflexota bacterium]
DSGISQYLGPVDGFLRIADPRAVKLPFEVVLERAREDAGSNDARSNAAEAAPVDAPGSSAGIDDDGPPRLAFRDVHAGYGDRPVLRGITAAFRRRETVAVLGPNGSGKTTLFRTAMRLLEPTSGTIEVDGSPIATKTVSQLATVFGYVFQSPSQMLFARTVREELAFGPRNLGRDPATFDQIIDEALGRTALADLEGIRERAPLTLSFGQQKRLALAIALCLQPPTLILDEPSAGQDHRTANGFLAAVSSIPGLESLYLVTHDVDLALTHADRILLMRDGELVADGPPTDVIADQEQWIACNLRPTSLLRANAQWGERPGRLLDSETLARRIVARERAAI